MPQATFIYGAGSPAMGAAATYRGDDYYMRFGLYGEPYKNLAQMMKEWVCMEDLWQPYKERLKHFI